MNNSKIKPVKDYWQMEACGSHFIKDYKDRKEFFKKYREYRYKVEWHIPKLVPFESFKGKSVLEIGCGNGVDGSMFVKNGADYTGIDLTNTAVEATQELFQIFNLEGTVKTDNAEKLSFPDECFDLVYSHGVLHHSPDPKAAINEIHRVLKSNGQIIVMLYHKHSFNYYVRVMGYMRLRLLLKILSRFFRIKRDRKMYTMENPVFISNTDGKLWEAHYRNYLEKGWSYLKAENFIHKCTDGPDCPFAYVYTKSDIRKLFANFNDIETSVAHFPIRNSRLGKIIPHFVEKLFAKWFGFYLFIYARKGQS